MSILQLEREIERVSAKIEACQAELSTLKQERKELRDQLDDAKRAVKNGVPPPAPSGFMENMTTRLNRVMPSLARFIGIRHHRLERRVRP